MTPAEEAAYLRRLADEIAKDARYGPKVRTITAAVLEGRAARLSAGVPPTTREAWER